MFPFKLIFFLATIFVSDSLSAQVWLQQGVDIDGEAVDDHSAWSVSLSSDGTAVAIGAPYNDGNGSNSGRTRIHAWDGSSWSQLGGDIDGEAAYDQSGYSVSLSSDGTVVAIGATSNDGIENNSGHVRIYALDGSSWSQLGGDIDGEAVNDWSGQSVSLSSDGTVVAIGAPYNDGNGSASGHVRIFALCDAPESSATAAVFGTGSSTSLNLASFTAPASGADGYAIYISDANSFTPPSQGDEPVADASWNGTGQQAIYFGTSSSPDVTVTDLAPGTPYYVHIYAYTDCSGTEVYEGTGLNATVSVCELLTVYDFMLLDTNAVNTFSITTQFNRALDSLSNHPLSPDVVNGHGFLDGHIIDNEVFMEYSIQQVLDSINALNGCED